MTFRPSYRGIWGVSYPLIVAGISETVVEVTDTVFLAHYGITELAAIGLAGAIYSLALALILGLVDGIQIVIGRRAGEGRAGQIGRVFNQGLYLLLVAALALTLIIKFALPGLTADLFASADVHVAVDDYLQIYAFALLFHAVNLAYSAFYVGIARTRVLIGATVILAAINILLDYLLIFGHFGLPALGIRGAAIASLTAEVAVFGYLTLDVVRRRYVGSFGLLRFGRWDGDLSRLLARISAPVSLEALVETARWFAFFLIIEQLGEDVLAKANIVFSIYAVLLIPIDGFSETICSMVSNLIGQRRLPQIGLLMRRTILLAYGVLTPLLVATLAFPEALLDLFSEDGVITSGTTASLFVVAAAASLAVPAETAYSAVAGTGDTRAILVFQLLIATGVLGVAWYTALVLGLPLEYIWLSEVAGWAIALMVSVTWLKIGLWRQLRV
ncbi:MAG: MATE family efflux transporter [Pseudomonadota bacterium]|nr:MATE family efflux transporter [Pseudomonadota bacterium]